MDLRPMEAGLTRRVFPTAQVKLIHTPGLDFMALLTGYSLGSISPRSVNEGNFLQK
jgi:hypothetical protein